MPPRFSLLFRLVLIHVHVPLGIGDTDSLGIEGFFDRFLGVQVDSPVIRGLDPGADHEIHAAAGMADTAAGCYRFLRPQRKARTDRMMRIWDRGRSFPEM